MITDFVSQLAKASDTQAVYCSHIGRDTQVMGSSPIRTFKIGLKILFRTNLI